MNDIRHSVLWVIFGFSMILLWDKWQVHNGNRALFFPAPAPTAPAASAGARPASADAAHAPAPAAGASPDAVPGQPAVSGQPAAVPVARERVQVQTDLYRLTFDSQGGSLTHAELLEHADMADKTRRFQLLDESAQRVYVAQTGLIGGSFPTHKTPMTALPGPRELAEGANELAIRFESPSQGGLKLVKTWTLRRGSYAIAVRHEVLNTGSATVSPQLYLQLVRDGNKPPGESSFYSTFTGPAVYTDAKKYQKIEFKDIENDKVDIPKEAPDGYVAMVQHYFATAWLLADGVQRQPFTRKVDTNLYSVGMLTPLGSIAPGASRTLDARLFAGPQVETMLETLSPGLELVKDYGWLTILAKPLYWLLEQLHQLLRNWGWSIVGLVLLLKIAFYWLNAKAYASMAKMKAINPKIMEMRERLKDKPQQMQQEMMRIYREEKVNPMGGCFPIVIQIPVFIALYWVLLSSVEMRNAPWIGWIHDLSTPDPLFILPLLMTASSLLQTALNPAPPDPMQAKMMWFMPLIFSVMFFFFPAGLVLYWLTNNILSIAQQWIINTRMGVPPQFNLPKFR
ncbi:membrane protein insertase YidC [Verminephrobacter eiseniae]|uniref:membrane protein insertase YidC n=1 Tax=Verminephrobacter eiseniae TaxID=364317 RepID=UPI0022371BC9|nr:membrane protein insertase YidC [Verminephrobacter eiseniae]MCW5232838.1 membrane protein insertase YidC [Verminephrobacter eiseniae]MCW5295610.1 membrane protein insertase YidC [Verminephrobacter eiseniae]MCW8187335.1 membrane protein insertase YidC [Verminephrobacter eiseniae]MCW8225712.1 membrane protein insertase YidC [Verminephrobacter eiseniae]MCW8236639.1 membrane protein insertase YidC [Verminephrobacter eiseniae]